MLEVVVSRELENQVGSQFDLPPLQTPATSVCLIDSRRSEGPSPVLVSTAVGFAFPFHSRRDGVCLNPQLCPERPSPPLSQGWLSWERLRFASLPSVSKPFQKYYRKARESRSELLDEKLVAESMAVMKSPVSFSAKEAAAVLPELNSTGGADSMKGCVKPSSSMKGCLWRRFLNPSPVVKASSIHTSVLETVVSSSTPEVKLG